MSDKGTLKTMMKMITYGAAVISLSLLSFNAYSLAFGAIKGKFDCPDIHNSQLCARNIEKTIISQNPIIQRVNETQLKIKLQNGKELLFVDSWDSEFYDENANFTAIELLNNNKFLLIHKQYWEGNSYVLVSLSNGKQIPLEGYPAMSPNNNLMIVAEIDLEAEYSPNTFQLYKVNKNGIVILFDAKPDNWGPDKVEWLSNTMVKFIKRRINLNYEPKKNPEFYVEEEKLFDLTDIKKLKIKPQ